MPETEGKINLDLRTVPLVMYHEDKRIPIGETTVDLSVMKKKGHVSAEAELTEVVATVFNFGT